MTGMEASDSKFPDRKFRILRAIAEGDLVAVHSSMTLKPGELELAVVHIVRFEGERIVEFWDLATQVPKDNPNAEYMADQANHVKEETQSQNTSHERDDKDPTPNGNHSGPTNKPGDSDRTRVADSEDRKGNKNQTNVHELHVTSPFLDR